MDIELFTLCDGAFNYNGKLTIVGSFTTINVNSLPARVKIAMALRIRVYSEDIGKKVMLINLMSFDGKVVPVNLSVNLEIKPTQEPVSYIAFTAELQGFPIESEGPYKAMISIDGKQLGEYPFNVILKSK